MQIWQIVRRTCISVENPEYKLKHSVLISSLDVQDLWILIVFGTACTYDYIVVKCSHVYALTELLFTRNIQGDSLSNLEMRRRAGPSIVRLSNGRKKSLLKVLLWKFCHSKF